LDSTQRPLGSRLVIVHHAKTIENYFTQVLGK
jgi:hypothetical protein